MQIFPDKPYPTNSIRKYNSFSIGMKNVGYIIHVLRKRIGLFFFETGNIIQ